jgi:hypothetical protein
MRAFLAWLATVVFVFVLPLAAWITHVINTIQDEQWILLIVGAFVFPIGIIHGIGVWFGLF